MNIFRLNDKLETLYKRFHMGAKVIKFLELLAVIGEYLLFLMHFFFEIGLNCLRYVTKSRSLYI